MLRPNAPKLESGFTLVELIVTVIIVGVLAAVAVPNLLGLFNQTRVDDGRRQIQTALKQAQRQAMRRGSSCTVTLNATSNTISANPTQCIAINGEVDNRLSFKGDSVGGASATNIVVIFNRKGVNILPPGSTTAERTIAIFRAGDTSTGSVKKCLILTPNLGEVKNGFYSGATTGNIVKSSCDVTNS